MRKINTKFDWPNEVKSPRRRSAVAASYHVIDREGNIAARDLASFKSLNAAVEDLLKKP
jgi:hypothetical protein